MKACLITLLARGSNINLPLVPVSSVPVSSVPVSSQTGALRFERKLVWSEFVARWMRSLS